MKPLTLKPTARVATLTKEMAQKLLDRVDDEYQRKRREGTIKRYVADMNEGNWIPGTAVIATDHKGRLINGQHVLVAFIRSDLKTLQVILQQNPDRNAIYGYDHGRSRTAGEDLKWEGVDRATAISRVINVLFQFEGGLYAGTGYSTGARGADHYPSPGQTREFAKSHPGIEAHLHKPPRFFNGKGIPIAAIHAASYVLYQYDQMLALEFMKQIFEGENIKPGSPVKVLLTYIDRKKTKARVRNGEMMAMIIKTWNAWCNNQPLRSVVPKPKEPFPEIVDPAQSPISPASQSKAARVQ